MALMAVVLEGRSDEEVVHTQLLVDWTYSSIH